MSSIRLLVTGLCLAVLAALGCSNDPSTPAATTGSADVFFSLNVDGAPLQVDAMIYTNAAGTKYSIKNLRFIVSDLQLHTDTGKLIALKAVHFYDLADATTQLIHVANLPHANYTGVSFRFGLENSKNIRNKYPAIPPIMILPPDLGADLGYHYMQLEGAYEGTGTPSYGTHTGPRHLDGTNLNFPGVVDATAYDFSFPVNISFTPAHIHEGGHGELEISFDLNGWYSDHAPSDGVDTQYDFKAYQVVMGNLDAQGKLQANGPACFSATMIATGGHDH
jgi:hypothetical protein